MTIDYRKMPIADLLPHAGNMVLVDEVIDYQPDSATARVRVSADSLFYDPHIKGIHSAIGLEWMAQTIALVAGIYALQHGQPVQVGFLLGTRNYDPLQKVFGLGEEYVIHVKQLFREDNGLGAFECTIQQDDHLIAESKLNVFAPKNVDEFLKDN